MLSRLPTRSPQVESHSRSLRPNAHHTVSCVITHPHLPTLLIQVFSGAARQQVTEVQHTIRPHPSLRLCTPTLT